MSAGYRTTDDLPAHSFTLQLFTFTSLVLPGQSVPPLDDSGLLQSLVLVTVCVPVPQVAEQEPNVRSSQLPQAPLTIKQNLTHSLSSQVSQWY